MYRLTAVERERLLLALGISLVLHLLFLFGTLLLPGFQGEPSRPESVPIEVVFEPLKPPQPEPVVPPQPEPPQAEPRPSATPAEPTPRSTPAQKNPAPAPSASTAKPAAPRPAAPQSTGPAAEPWTPEPAPSFQQNFGSAPQSSREGGRLSAAETADSRAQYGSTSFDSGSEKGDAPVVAQSSSDDSSVPGLSQSDLARLDEALKSSSSGGGSSGVPSGSRVSAQENVGDIGEIESALSYRNARYTGLPGLTDDVARQLAEKGLASVNVDISFVISPTGGIDDLQTSVASVYPALDAFLQKNLPRVLSFDPLPGSYQNLWQKISVELVVKSN